ncbi:MAG: hypothetical protein QXK24_09015 [Ignisphaera sp.]
MSEIDESLIGEIYDLIDDCIFALEYLGVVLIMVEELVKDERVKNNIIERQKNVNELIDRLKIMRGRLKIIIKEM